MKQFIFILALLVLLSSASADIFVVDPVLQHVSSSSSIDLGSIQPGETFELIISKDAGHGKDSYWISAVPSTSDLPKNFNVSSSIPGSESHIITVKVPGNALIGDYSFQVLMSNVSGRIENESLTATFRVQNDLLNASLSNPSQLATLGKQVDFKMNLLNNSLSSEKISIFSSSPSTWFSPIQLELKRNSFQEIDLKVFPQLHGTHNVDFTVYSDTLNKSIAFFKADISVKPTLRSKYDVALQGFPFFTITLLPYYLFNSFVTGLGH